MATYVRYEADGWGVGELVFEDDRLAWHELPRPCVGAADGSHPLAERLRSYFGGKRVDFADVELEAGGWTEFRHAAVDALRRVPWGEVVTYGELAALAGRPNAQRAAGSVCAGNPFPIVVPCHRVVSATGIGPYGSLGSEYKQRLLALEHVVL
ncbi:MAG: methylated-DNA--[protein]-cysteine S-methyltransferase [Actinomycetota bacterium]|nr:methylated-DNA--[protein]-cysteine S-methyltransferase [Actinomycetota bacterium]